ncbi:MAG: lytic transglycosylase domain-containing protein [Phycisphaerales bacterium JB063]
MRRRRKRRRKPRLPSWLNPPDGYAGWLWYTLIVTLLAIALWMTVDQCSQRTTLPAELDQGIEEAAEDYGLPIELVRAVVRTESGGDPAAHSSANARGLMQITPITHREVIQRFDLPHADDDKLYDPDYNLDIGTRYLAYLLKRFDGDTKLALAAYHMGPTAVARLRIAHPTLTTDQLLALDGEGQVGPKTRAYVANVMRRAGMENN